jgi:hypothetical protein
MQRMAPTCAISSWRWQDGQKKSDQITGLAYGTPRPALNDPLGTGRHRDAAWNGLNASGVGLPRVTSCGR